MRPILISKPGWVACRHRVDRPARAYKISRQDIQGPQCSHCGPFCCAARDAHRTRAPSPSLSALSARVALASIYSTGWCKTLGKYEQSSDGRANRQTSRLQSAMLTNNSDGIESQRSRAAAPAGVPCRFALRARRPLLLLHALRSGRDWRAALIENVAGPIEKACWRRIYRLTGAAPHALKARSTHVGRKLACAMAATPQKQNARVARRRVHSYAWFD